MSPEKVWNALAGYDKDLDRLGYVARQFEPAEYAAKVLPMATVLAHCRWMAQKCLSAFRAEFEAAWGEIESEFASQHEASWPLVERAVEARKPLEKAMRWLCYVQGACHSYGLYSCDELRDHSRGGEGEFKPAGEEHAARRYVPPPFFRPSDRYLLKTREMPDFAEREIMEIPLPEDSMRTTLLGDPGKQTGIHDPAVAARLLESFRAERGATPPTAAEDARYAELEKEHLGDPERRTGIYAPRPVEDAPPGPQGAQLPAPPPYPD